MILNISKAFDRVWDAGLLHKLLSLIEFQVRCLALFLLCSVVDSFEWFWMESLHKNIQLMVEFLKAPFFFLVYIIDLHDDVICDIAIYADDTTLYS